MSRLLKEGPCDAGDVQPSQVTFFDDRIHDNLEKKLGQESILVDRFDYKVNTDTLADLYQRALKEAGFFSDPETETKLLNYINRHCRTLNTKIPFTFDNHIKTIAKLNGVTAPPGTAPPARLEDTDILVAAVKRHDRVEPPINLVEPPINLGNNPLSAVGSNVFMGGSGSGRERRVRHRMVTRRKRSKHAAKKSRHIRRRR